MRLIRLVIREKVRGFLSEFAQFRDDLVDPFPLYGGRGDDGFEVVELHEFRDADRQVFLFSDGVDLTPDDIYRVYTEKGILPHTAAINMEEYICY